ncbi:hypothetical protein RhiirA4_468183 [Rhizophagus irregularis]|uniref:Uncharacterized protein n=1 Tax=Rhizophagus irregularis TaxID=588596 RepID=A0A2I1GXK6_9GLOM|nr:hypothetical protein RhiirA4_468183 [Rhizophagus irregularis]
MSKTNENSDELSKENNKIIECDDVDKHLNVYSFNLYMDAVPTLFQKAITNDRHRVQKSTVSTENLIKWDININHIEINLAVFKKHNTEWNLISRRIDNHHYKYKYSGNFYNNHKLIMSSLFNNNDINNIFIMIINLELIDDIYKKCMTYFKEDPMNNKSFLSIITSAMPLLDEYYPEYILKYSSETNMIIDSSFYSIEHRNKNLHLYSFTQSPQMVNLSRSLLWTKYYYKFYCTFHYTKNIGLLLLFLIIFAIQILIILLTFPLYLATFYILSKYNFINNIYITDVFTFVYFFADLKIFKIIKKDIPTTPTITFMIPYINFVNYSNDYNWLLKLIRPQPSSFTETINRNIYKTWNGKALINFKWNTYGKYYYEIIWILFMTLLGCFTAAAMIPQQYINEEVRQQLFITSIILGFIHLIFEIRQFFYNIIKWFYNFWNIFGKYV